MLNSEQKLKAILMLLCVCNVQFCNVILFLRFSHETRVNLESFFSDDNELVKNVFDLGFHVVALET